MDDCIFCKIIKKEISSSIVYEDSDVIIFKNIEPLATIHLLVCPIKHVPNFMELENEIMPIVKATQKVIKDLKIDNAYKLVFNGGKYQTIPHLHWHLLAGDLEKNNDILNKL